jgi:hypothetical protein
MLRSIHPKKTKLHTCRSENLISHQYWDGSQLPSCYCMLLTQPSLCKFIKITPPPLSCKVTKSHNFKLFQHSVMIHKNKILPPLSQALTTHHPNFFTLILTLSEGRASIGWVPYDKMLFVPSYIKQFSLPPNVCLFTSTLLLLFLTLSLFYTFHLSTFSTSPRLIFSSTCL